jgi:hypothetical protein
MAKKNTGPATTAEIRAWANDHGIVVGPRGRLSSAVIALWKKRHPRREVA